MNDDKDTLDHNKPKNIVTTILSKLTPKSLLVLIIVALFLVTSILGIAVFRGSRVNIFGIMIDPNTAIESEHTSTSSTEPGKRIQSLNVKLAIQFEPALDETVNLRSEGIKVTGYVKAIDGTRTKINTRKIVAAGGIYVEAEIPDIKDPFYIVIDTPPGKWISDDFNISESNLKAYFMGQDTN